MKIRQLICLISLATISLTSYAQEWLTDFDRAKQKSQELNRPIILVFQGLDWCAPCIKMDKEIWHTKEFMTHASDHYVLLKADFPRRRKNALSEDQQNHNNNLAEKYNQRGHFPLVVILDHEGNVLGEYGFNGKPVSEYIAMLDDAIAKLYSDVNTKLMTPGEGTRSLESQTKPAYINKRSLQLMGCNFDITVVAEDANTSNHFIDMAIDEMTRIERLISSWDANSQTSEINNFAGIRPVKVDAELFDLIERSIALSKVTDGAFDISYASMDNIWKFDGSMLSMPDDKEIRHSVQKVGYEHITLDRQNHTVFLQHTGMKIGFGAIGKGYAADKAKELLVSHGVVAGIINASGDMSCWGKQPSGEPWRVAIKNPFDEQKSYALLPINNGAVVTSGDYEKFVEFDGVRYAHIIDPRTGYPSSGLISVTVFAPQAELADALATSVFVMGQHVGIDRINQLSHVECIVIDEQGDIHTSKNIHIDQL